MKSTKTLKVIGFCAVLAGLFISSNSVTFAAGLPQVQTLAVTNISGTSVTLQGNVSDMGGVSSVGVWFQWGSTQNYGTNTNYVVQNYNGAFSQQIVTSPGQTYHYRAVAQNSYGISYGQDMTFVSGQNSGNSQVVVNAGPNVYVTSNQSTVLQASAYTTSGSITNYSWTCTGGSLSNYNILQPTYTAPFINQNNNQQTYTCTLTATNNSGQSNSASTTIYVNSNGNNSNTFSVQTNTVTNNVSNQAVLNGYVTDPNATSVSVWFQWGTDTNYGYVSFRQGVSSSQYVSQNIANLINNQTYHYRAVAQDNYGNTVYGQDMTFVSGTSTSYNPVSGNGLISLTKSVRNLSSGNLTWSSVANATGSDVMQFLVTIQAPQNQTIHNITLRDSFPANLIYNNNLTVNGVVWPGNITQGISIGDLSAGQQETISYQAQVAQPSNFSYGQTTLVNSVSLTSSDGNNVNASASVYVTRQGLLGAATAVSTGLTNDLFVDSLFLPLVLIMLAFWLQKSALANSMFTWIKIKTKK